MNTNQNTNQNAHPSLETLYKKVTLKEKQQIRNNRIVRLIKMINNLKRGMAYESSLEKRIILNDKIFRLTLMITTVSYYMTVGIV
jgi:hypothetical protein